MTPARLTRLLREVRTGRQSVPAALRTLKDLPYHNLGFARVDHHRPLRQGMPEVIYGEGKMPAQITAIAERILQAGADLLVTRVEARVAEGLRRLDPRAVHHQAARMVVVRQRPSRPIGQVVVVSAGTSDLPVAEEARVTAEALGSRVTVLYDVGVAGIHRLLARLAVLRRARAVVVVAGMDGALAGVVGGLIARPVIAVPTSVGYGAAFGGVSALLAMLNCCAAGVGVVNIDNGFGGGCLAHRINCLGQRAPS